MTEAWRVLANFGATVAVQPQDQRHPDSIRQAVTLSRIPLLVAGDRVHCEEQAGSLRVIEMLDRFSVLQRPDRRGQLKPLAANLTHLAIVSASPPGMDTLLIDQFCLAAELAGIEPLILINKADLLDEDALHTARALCHVYSGMGYPCVQTDTRSASGIQRLGEALAGRVVALAGASGVGKSSIVKALLPDIDIRVGAVSPSTGLGAHTTTVALWYHLPGEGALVDSPGVRQFSVSHLSPEAVRSGYRDIASLAVDCRFNNCTHCVEPGCAVRDALAAGELSDWRYANYRQLIGEGN